MKETKLQNEIETFKDGERFYDEVNIESTRDVRRAGSGFDTLANILRGIKELGFSNAFKIVNRPGRRVDANKKLETGLVNVKNAFEMFYAQKSDDGINTIVLGRQGDGKFRNTHLIDVNATHNTTIGSKEGRNNGYIKLRVTRDEENPESDRSGINIYDPGTVNDVGLSGVVIQIASQGTNGGVAISHIVNKEDSPTGSAPYILIDSDGIQMLNLPTSNPGGSGILWNSSGTLRIT